MCIRQKKKKRAKQLLVEELHCYINEDLLSEIFIRAPAKTLGRCKCVKLFNSLISDQNFITRHSSRALTDIDGLFHFSKSLYAMIYLLPFDNSSSSNTNDLPRQCLFADDHNYHRKRMILASCSGILLLDFLDDIMEYFYLCNPTTKKYLRIPKFKQHRSVNYSAGLCMIESSHAQSYKLVFVYYEEQSEDSERYRFIIFSKETLVWKLSNETISCSSSNIFKWSNSVYYRGALHWLREKGVDILAFHVQKEQARMISTPENTSVRGDYQDIWFRVEPRDDLLNMVLVLGNQVVIWVLGDYENMKWQVRRRIEIDWIDRVTSLSPKFFDGETLVMVERKKVLEEIVIFDAHIYNIRTGERNTKKLPMWLDSRRVFVPCTNTLMDL